MSTVWRTLQITPTESTPVNYYFTTGSESGNIPITGIYEIPYNGENLLLEGFAFFNTVDSKITTVNFLSLNLKGSYEEVGYTINGDEFNLSVDSVVALAGSVPSPLEQVITVGDAGSAWYTLDITPDGGTAPVKYYFSTVAGNGFQPITGIFNDPYESDDISTIAPNPLNIFPVYNPDFTPLPSYIRVLFTSTELQTAYANASPSISTSADFIIARPDTPSDNYYLVGYYDIGTNNYVIIQQNGVSIVGTTNPSCFNEGTKILCLNKKMEEEYIKIENLRRGDLVKCYKHGYRRIDLIGKGAMINNPVVWNGCMYKMEKTDENELIEDLIITGGHAILVDDLGDCKEENDGVFGGNSPTIDGKYLLLAGVSNWFKKLENKNTYTYYHFVVENNGNEDMRYGVWANGILTETPSKQYFTSQNFSLLD